MVDGDGTWPQWLKNIAVGVAVIAVCAAVTVATGGAGAGVAGYIAAGALKGAVIGAAAGAASGATIVTVKHVVTTGSWKGAGKAALEGGSKGFAAGAITGAITGGAGRAVKVLRNTKVTTSSKLSLKGKRMSSKSLVRKGRIKQTRFYNARGKAHFDLDYDFKIRPYHSRVHGHRIKVKPFFRSKQINNLWKSRW